MPYKRRNRAFSPLQSEADKPGRVALRLAVVGVLCSVKLNWLFGDVAQLVRALPCHGRGRGFEPRRPRHDSKRFRIMRDPKKTEVVGLIWVQ